MLLGDARVLVTSPRLYERKVAAIRAELPGLKHVLIAGEGPVPPGTIDLDPALAAAAAEFDIPHTEPADMALLHFTSGTTGKPKGAVHVHEAVVAHHATAAFALDLHAGDVFWCTADPGWVTGTSYGIIAPLTHGATLVTDAGEFDAKRWYAILSDQRVTVWYTAPTALRMLMRHGAGLPAQYDLSALRLVASVGEPLNPEAVVWGVEALGQPVHDNWWQTETGAIMISNFPAMEIRPGSMGKPLPGVRAALLETGRGRQGSGDRWPGGGDHGAGRGGGTRAAAGLAVDVPRVPARPGALRGGVRRRLVPDRRRRAAGCGRLLLVRRPRGRRHQIRRSPDRPVRSGERADGAPGGRRGRRDRQARPGGR